MTTAANGKLALELLKAKEYDVVLIDFLMPVRVQQEKGSDMQRLARVWWEPTYPRALLWGAVPSSTSLCPRFSSFCACGMVCCTGDVGRRGVGEVERLARGAGRDVHDQHRRAGGGPLGDGVRRRARFGAKHTR